MKWNKNRIKFFHAKFLLVKLLLVSIIMPFSVNGLSQAKDNSPYTANYSRAIEALQKSNYTEALDYLNKEIEEHPRNSYAYALIAEIRKTQGEYGLALSAADVSIKLLPKSDADSIKEMHPKTHNYCTNWITFYK